jgi:hypothetical protein
MPTYLRWMLINLCLPLSPFALRVFMIFMGKNQNFSFSRIAELPEILFYSIFVCVITLNINLDAHKKRFESLLRLFLQLIIVLDVIVLGMIYSNNFGPNTLVFSIVAAIIPALIAPIYKFYYLDNKEESKKNVS